MKLRYAFWAASSALVALGASARAQVTLVEPGHMLTKLVDSLAPLHPTQSLLETTTPVGEIESIGVDPFTGDLYIQLDAFFTTHIFRVSPTGIVTPVALNTGFDINERGADLWFDKITGLLVTQDGVAPSRIASIHPITGLIGTWSTAAPVSFGGVTFGMDFSAGIGGTDVPVNQIVFVSDIGVGIHSAAFGGIATTPHVTGAMLPGGGDDMVIQPNGDWVWVGDFAAGIISISPAPPHLQTPSALTASGIFAGAGLPFVFGTRATVCKSGGEVYVSYSGGSGGTGVFRLDPALTTATLVATIGVGAGGVTAGLQDLQTGPSTSGAGESLFITVHTLAGAEQVWEITTPECPEAECFLVFGGDRGVDPFGVASHTWSTQLSGVNGAHVVTMERGPEFIVPELMRMLPRQSFAWPVPPADARTPIARFTAQVVMWNPGVFPQNPEQWTNGLEVLVWNSRKITAIPYGNLNNMHLSVVTYQGQDGKQRLYFPFTID